MLRVRPKVNEMIDHYIDINFGINRSVYNNMAQFISLFHINMIDMEKKKSGLELNEKYPFPIGISFPKVNPKGLGGRIRLHGNLSDLQTIMKYDNWESYANLNIEKVPDNCKYRSFYRSNIQTPKKTNMKRKRVMEKFGASFEEACEQYPELYFDLPYFNIYSNTSKEYFKLFVDKSDIKDEYKYGGFDSYGFSRSSIPTNVHWF